MRRQSNDPQDEVTLFVANCKLIILNQRKQIDYAFRTIQLTQNMIYIYPSQTLQESKISSSKSNLKGAVVQLQKLSNHQSQYMITSTMRPKLLLYKRDPDILAYLKQLKAPEIRLKEGEQVNIVAIAVEEAIGKYINGFIFSREKDAIEFYEGLNFGIGFQMYMKLLGNTLPCNYKLSNRIGEILNGRCCIDPLDFIEGKSQEDEINFFVQLLKTLRNESLFNFHTNLFETQLYFRIIDQMSLAYACKFIGMLTEKIQKLILCQCALTSNMFGQIMLSNPSKFIDKFTALQALDLSDNNLNDDIFTSLANMLKSSKNLHEINLSKNQISCEKQSILFSFLQSITKFKLSLNLSKNLIKSAHIIAKYFVNVDGNIPIDILNLYGNPFKPEQLSMLVKRYMERREMLPDYRIQIKLGQLEFQDPAAFQFLKRQFRQKQPTAMSVPLLLSRHPFRKQGKEIGMTQEEADQSAVIDGVLKQYSAELFSGNFYKRKKLKDKLLQLGVDIEEIENEPAEMKALRKQQQLMVINKLQNCCNFNVPSHQIVSYLNQTLKYLRIKGLTGPGVAFLAEIKLKMEKLFTQWQKEQKLGKPFREIFYLGKNRYQTIYEQLLNESDVLAFDLASLADQQDQKLLEFLKNQKVWSDSDLFIAAHHLWYPSYPKQWHKTLLQSCLSDPRLSNAKILHESKFNSIKFHEVQRINKSGTMLKKSMVDIAAHYGIETYKFSRSFIESGQSSSGYAGLLSDCKYQPQQESTIMSLIHNFNNFMQILYHTPNEISEQAILYITTITEYLMDHQHQADNDLKCLLTEELLIRVMTYFDSTKHQKLKRGNIILFCEFLLRRVSIDNQIIYRLIAYLVKTDSYLQTEMNFHFSSSKLPWEGKIDWKVKDPSIRQQLLLKKGKLTISIADISNQKLELSLEVDELSTVGELMGEVAQNIDKISQFTNVNKAQLHHYWLCGSQGTSESYQFKFLPSYEHIGRLLFQDQLQRKFYLRRVTYPPQYHSLTSLRSMNYQDLLCLFAQVRQSFRESAFIMLSDDRNQLKVKMTIEAIWIDALIQEEILLSPLRAQQNGEDWSRYRNQREKLINEGLAKIYLKYLPVNTVLNEEARNSVVTELRAKKNEPVTRVMSEMIRQRIVSFISTIGVCGYTVSISDSKNSSIFFVNNHQFCFLDRSTKPAQCIKSQFKYILRLELLRQVQPLLKFEGIEAIEQEVLQRHQFTIGGEESWLAQCYALLIGVCKTRLAYPAKLLFANQDSPNGISDTKFDENQITQRQPEAFLDVDNLFIFDLQRSQRFAKQKRAVKKQLPPMQLQQIQVEYHKGENKNNQFKKEEEIKKQNREDKVLKKQREDREEINIKKQEVQQSLKPESIRQSNQKQQSKITLPIPAIPQRSSYSEASVRRPSQPNLEIEEIIQNVGSQSNQNDQIVTARRSSTKNASKRRSRKRQT